MTDRVIVVTPHVSNYPDPVRFRRGERVRVGAPDRNHPGWIRVRDAKGRSGWAPEKFLDSIGDGLAIALEDYDATELDVVAGERLNVHRLVSGWYWVSDAHGRTGWVPAQAIRPLQN